METQQLVIIFIIAFAISFVFGFALFVLVNKYARINPMHKIGTKLDLLIFLQKQNMANDKQQFEALMGRLDSATSAMARRFQKLLDAVKDDIPDEQFEA